MARAGAMPNNSTTAVDMKTVNDSIRPLSEKGSWYAPMDKERKRTRNPEAAGPSNRPSALPAPANMKLSVSSCLSKRERLAPRDSRTPTSCWRADARANRRFPMLRATIKNNNAEMSLSRIPLKTFMQNRSERRDCAIAGLDHVEASSGVGNRQPFVQRPQQTPAPYKTRPRPGMCSLVACRTSCPDISPPGPP